MHLLQPLAVGVDSTSSPVTLVAGRSVPRRATTSSARRRRLTALAAQAAARPGRGGPARAGPRPAPSAARPPGRRRRRTDGPPPRCPGCRSARASWASSTSPRTTVSGVRSSWLASSRNWRSVAMADSTAVEEGVEAGGQAGHLVVAGGDGEPPPEPAGRQPGRLVGQLRHRPQGGADQDPRRRAEGQRRDRGRQVHHQPGPGAGARQGARRRSRPPPRAGPLGVVTGVESSRACAPRPSTARSTRRGPVRAAASSAPASTGPRAPNEESTSERPVGRDDLGELVGADDGVGPLHRRRADVGQPGVQLAVDGVVDRAGQHASTPRSRRWRRGWRPPRRRRATAAPAATGAPPLTPAAGSRRPAPSR